MQQADQCNSLTLGVRPQQADQCNSLTLGVHPKTFNT